MRINIILNNTNSNAITATAVTTEIQPSIEKNETSSWGQFQVPLVDTPRINKQSNIKLIEYKIRNQNSTRIHKLCTQRWIILLNNNLEGPRVSASCFAAKTCILWDGIFIPEWSWCCVNTQIKLLSKVLSCPRLRPQVPHTYVIQCYINRRPWLGIHLHSS